MSLKSSESSDSFSDDDDQQMTQLERENKEFQRQEEEMRKKKEKDLLEQEKQLNSKPKDTLEVYSKQRQELKTKEKMVKPSDSLKKIGESTHEGKLNQQHDEHDENVEYDKLQQQKSKKKKDEKRVSQNEDIQRVLLKRTFLDKFCDHPKFDETVRDCFVRITVATEKQQRYILGQIIDIKEYPYQYKIEQKSTKKRIEVQYGQQKKVLEMQYVSNGGLSPSEYFKWQKIMEGANLELPTLKEIEEKQKKLKQLYQEQMTGQDIEKYIEKQINKKEPKSSTLEENQKRKKWLQGEYDQLEHKLFSESMNSNDKHKIKERLKELKKQINDLNDLINEQRGVDPQKKPERLYDNMELMKRRAQMSTFKITNKFEPQVTKQYKTENGNENDKGPELKKNESTKDSFASLREVHENKKIEFIKSQSKLNIFDQFIDNNEVNLDGYIEQQI